MNCQFLIGYTKEAKKALERKPCKACSEPRIKSVKVWGNEKERHEFYELKLFVRRG